MTGISGGSKKWTGLIWKQTIAIAVLIMAVTGTTLGWIGTAVGNSANDHAGRVASCLNDNLNDRNGKGNAYDDAVSDAFDLFGRLLAHQVDPNSPKVRAEFLKDINTIRSVAAYRKAHPLGRCT